MEGNHILFRKFWNSMTFYRHCWGNVIWCMWQEISKHIRRNWQEGGILQLLAHIECVNLLNEKAPVAKRKTKWFWIPRKEDGQGEKSEKISYNLVSSEQNIGHYSILSYKEKWFRKYLQSLNMWEYTNEWKLYSKIREILIIFKECWPLLNPELVHSFLPKNTKIE